MPASTITNSLPPACGLMSTTSREEHAGLGDEKPSRFEDEIEAALADDRQHARGVLRRGRHALSLVRDAEPAADIEVLDGDARVASSAARPAAPRRRAGAARAG
jgi:hypothetical protein